MADGPRLVAHARAPGLVLFCVGGCTMARVPVCGCAWKALPVLCGWVYHTMPVCTYAHIGIRLWVGSYGTPGHTEWYGPPPIGQAWAYLSHTG